MFRYRVTFETEVQVDGWSDFRDREYQKRRETITVSAKNLKHAETIAVKQAFGYSCPAYWGPPHVTSWAKYHIKKVTRVKCKRSK